jgi:hypothetical protein
MTKSVTGVAVITPVGYSTYIPGISETLKGVNANNILWHPGEFKE